MSDTIEQRILDVTDKMKLLQWLYPDVYAKLTRGEDKMYKCNCGFTQEQEWYPPYPAHDDTCPIQIEQVSDNDD
jgi:hypothetical protein